MPDTESDSWGDRYRVARFWEEFSRRWGGLYNFLLDDALTQFRYQVPPLERIIDEVRHAPDSIVRSGIKGDVFDLTDIKEEFLRLPLDEAMQSRFVLAHFRLHPNLSGAGQVFEGIDELWVEPWQRVLRQHGFTFEEVFPILFASGPHSASNYHLDKTHQLAWQCYGTKYFYGLKDPDRWTTAWQRAECSLHNSVKPEGITADDVYSIEQSPGTILWNTVAIPHWVETRDQCAATLTLVHRGLRLHGQLCPHGTEREHMIAAPVDKRNKLNFQ